VKAVYRHTNLIAWDWQRLSRFYQDVFGCTPVPPQRRQSGQWLADGTGVPDAALEGEHLRLPGCGEAGPTLEIYGYAEVLPRPEPAANRSGFGHLAFEVDDVAAACQVVFAAGGKPHGQVVRKAVPGVGLLTFTYVRDPEDNLIELQSWRYPEVT
jgi:catechol 2,3-dioxygenase-like lactoylglutathione lyase family enzyme